MLLEGLPKLKLNLKYFWVFYFFIFLYFCAHLHKPHAEPVQMLPCPPDPRGSNVVMVAIFYR